MVIMIRSGQKILSIFLLLPILTILAHSSILHHHHASPVEICCGNRDIHSGTFHIMAAPRHSPAGHHDACCFNPEFTFDLNKILVTAAESELVTVTCPLKLLASGHLVSATDDVPCRKEPAPSLLRGPPSIG
jgi:hypothetical protein